MEWQWVCVLPVSGKALPVISGRAASGQGIRVMSAKKLFTEKKKDARNGKESGQWRPGKWTDAHVRRFLRHVTAHAWDQASYFGPRMEVHRELIEFLQGAKDRESAAMLARAGVRTIGDVERGA
jgi:hypothetical protein